MSFPLNVLFGNFSLFGPLIKKIMRGIPQTKAMLSTSISFTTMFAGSREENLYRGLDKIKKIAAKYDVEIQEMERDYCQPTSFTDCPFQLLEESLEENFPDVIVAPFLLTAGTDARRFTDVADSILRFAPIDLDKAQYASIHGANEHIKIQNIGQCVCFYKDIIGKYEERLQ